MPIISKRLNARYDWLKTQWSRKSCQLVEAGDGCGPAPPSVAGAVAWVSEGNCSFFTKVGSRRCGPIIQLLRAAPLWPPS